MTKKANPEYFVVAVKRHYEETWRFVSKHLTREDAEAELDKRRAYTGAFNYDNADLRVLSRTEARKEFGPKWDYKPIGADRRAAKQQPEGEMELE
jgi:hypothetical protein